MGYGERWISSDDDSEFDYELAKRKEREDGIIRAVAAILWAVLTGITLLILVY